MIIFKRFIVLPTFRVHSSMQYHFRFGMRCTFSITKSFRVCEECVCVCAVCGAGLWFRRFSTLITFCCFCYVCCWSFESCCRYLSSRSNETPTTRIRSLFLELNVCTVHFQPLKSIRSKVRKHLLFEFNDLPINGVMMPISIFFDFYFVSHALQLLRWTTKYQNVHCVWCIFWYFLQFYFSSDAVHICSMRDR